LIPEEDLQKFSSGISQGDDMYPTFVILIAFLFAYYLNASKFSRTESCSCIFLHVVINLSFMLITDVLDDNQIKVTHGDLFSLNLILVEILFHFSIYGIKNEIKISKLIFFSFSFIIFFGIHPKQHSSIYKEKYQYTTDYKENLIRQYTYNDYTKEFIPMVIPTADNHSSDMWIKYSGQDDLKSYYVAYSKINHYDLSETADVLARFYIGPDGRLIFIGDIVTNVPGKDLVKDYLKNHPNIKMSGFQAPSFYDSLPIS
jgi:hypothetical protein